MIIPQFANGFNIIKFVNNHPRSFDQPFIAYMLGLTQIVYGAAFELINIIGLISANTVEVVLLQFVGLAVMIQLQTIYYHSFSVSSNRGSILNKVFDPRFRPPITNKAKSNSFKERPCTCKLGRILFKLLRSLYIVLIFYCAPIIFFNIQCVRVFVSTAELQVGSSLFNQIGCKLLGLEQNCVSGAVS